MGMRPLKWLWVGVLALHIVAPGVRAAPVQMKSQSKVEAALQNILTLNRPHQEGLATFWDGNKYVQCRRTADRLLLCEAAGSLMQPSLDRVLTPDRVARLTALGWHLDPSFGNYVQTFAAGLSASAAASMILQTMSEGYEADIANLDIETDWITSETCPPRNGPKQNLAGMINDAPAMKATSIHACAYTMPPPSPTIRSANDLIDLDGARVTGEIQRLQVNFDRNVFLVLSASSGYLQCAPQASPPALYCEAVSAESWPIVASILTPDRLARLHAAGFADPGRSQNYSKTYPLDGLDAAAVARDLLTLLYDAYGYTGKPKLKITTEKD